MEEMGRRRYAICTVAAHLTMVYDLVVHVFVRNGGNAEEGLARSYLIYAFLLPALYIQLEAVERLVSIA
jgi:hypothetical protein